MLLMSLRRKSIFKSEPTSSFIRTTYWDNHLSSLYTADWKGKITKYNYSP